MSHTPTPWIIDIDGRNIIGQGNGYPVVGKVKRERDAAFVVKAVNAHEDLVKALQEARAQITYLHEKFAKTGTGEATITKIDAALAKAGASA